MTYVYRGNIFEVNRRQGGRSGAISAGAGAESIEPGRAGRPGPSEPVTAWRASGSALASMPCT